MQLQALYYTYKVMIFVFCISLQKKITSNKVGKIILNTIIVIASLEVLID